MKLASIAKSDNRNTETWIPEAWSVKVTFSLAVTLYLSKTGNRIKKSLT